MSSICLGAPDGAGNVIWQHVIWSRRSAPTNIWRLRLEPDLPPCFNCHWRTKVASDESSWLLPRQHVVLIAISLVA